MNKSLLYVLLVFAILTSMVLIVQANPIDAQSSKAVPTKMINSTSTEEFTVGNLTNIIKHPSIISILTTSPWPKVKAGQNFEISGELIDGITLKPIPNAAIEFKAIFTPLMGPSIQTLHIPSQNTDSIGSFSVKSNSPNQSGGISVIAIYKGDQQHYATISVPSLLFVLTF
jgi:hypothetical protein